VQGAAPEKKASRTLVNALKEKLDRPGLANPFCQVFKQQAAAKRDEAPSAADEAERRVKDCERRLANLTDSLARVGWSDALAVKLRDDEAQLSRLKRWSALLPAGRPLPVCCRIRPHELPQNFWSLRCGARPRGALALRRACCHDLSSFLLETFSESRSGNSGCAGAQLHVDNCAYGAIEVRVAEPALTAGDSGCPGERPDVRNLARPWADAQPTGSSVRPVAEDCGELGTGSH
jgi:hypothetical protein